MLRACFFIFKRIGENIMYDKKLIKVENGFLSVPTGYFVKPLANEGFLLSKSHGPDFIQMDIIPVTKKHYVSAIINKDEDVFVRQATQGEINRPNIVRRKAKDSGRIFGAECYVTKQYYLRMQSEQLSVICNNNFKGYWVFNMHIGKRNYIEVSFQKTKGKLKTFREAALEQGYSIVELPKAKEINLKFYLENSGSCGYQFTLPRVFMQKANIEKGMFLDWKYNDDYTKIIVEEPRKICPVCQSVITLDTQRKDVYLSASTEGVLRTSSYRQEFETIKERLSATTTYYETEINAVKHIIETL